MSDWTGNRNQEPKDWALIESFIKADLDDRRRSARWRWLRRALLLVIIAALAVSYLKDEAGTSSAFGPHTAVVFINGQIAGDSPANAQSINDSLAAAFESTEAKAIVLSIDSPGGSPVQADEVYREIRRLRKLHADTPVYAVIGDTGASGAYYIAVAADKIFVNPSSLVGSIGVIMPGFGVPNLLQKLGVEDRTLTAGEHKNLLSPARAVDPVEREHVQSVLDAVHRHFITAVKAGRGARLSNNPDLFSGYFWSGDQAIALGLADAVGSVASVARDVVKHETLVDYTEVQNPLDSVLRRLGSQLGKSLGAAFKQSVTETSQAPRLQ
ncbi:signal peptide peptidase SppA [Perlucidibaca aquatica]|jgi:protease-4|uniref:signal peptide peptidase SppA n=1 Tax=Perlucidibaca aquatica TaxID=1852776 RepID=UPI00083A2C02|nr:signal peptide peptidase SppA [Perlucidibaca aquatica]